MTFEELTTLLCQIEACLNSRPISAMSTNPEDCEPLTPGHFITGAPLTAPPEENLLDINTNRLNRWQTVYKMSQSFWKRWSNEYLNCLQQRTKWTTKQEEPQINDLVFIKDENIPPLKWPMARILQKQPGADGLTRVVTLKTADTIIKRPITKICKLALDNELTKASNDKQNMKVNANHAKITHNRTYIQIIVFLLLNMALLTRSSPTMSNKMQIRPFHHKPGIFFEETGRAYLSNTKWTIIVRAALDIVGNIASDLFGVLDQRFAREYTEDINTIKNNEEHLITLLIKNQTSITETTINMKDY